MFDTMSVMSKISTEFIKLFSPDMKIKTAILGGTFNPPHNGHLHIAKSASDILGYERIIFIPNYIPPHKDSDNKIEAEDRLVMTSLAAEHDSRFVIEKYEIEKEGVSYTIDTVNYIYEKYKDISGKLGVIFGSDLISDFHLWKNAKALSEKTKLIAFGRENEDIKKKYTNIICEYNITVLDSDFLDISSTMIRSYIKEGRSVKCLLPENVLDYIKKHGLYI